MSEARAEIVDLLAAKLPTSLNREWAEEMLETMLTFPHLLDLLIDVGRLEQETWALYRYVPAPETGS